MTLEAEINGEYPTTVQQCEAWPHTEESMAIRNPTSGSNDGHLWPISLFEIRGLKSKQKRLESAFASYECSITQAPSGMHGRPKNVDFVEWTTLGKSQ